MLITNSITDDCYVSNKTKERGYTCPLYVYPQKQVTGLSTGRKPNLTPEFVTIVASTIGLEFVPEGTGDLESTFGPEDILHYLYAVLHSPEYRRRYADFLKSDFPRVPMTGDRVLFASLTGLGQHLAALHLMEADADGAPAFPIPGDNRVDKMRYVLPSDDAPGRVWINGKQYFEGVVPETWSFTVGGYQPAGKWLKDRKGRRLSFDDIAHYRRICAALAETPRIMIRIDETIEAHGGWPLA